MEPRESIVKAQAFDLPKDYAEVLSILDVTQIGTLIKNVFEYFNNNELEEMDDITRVAFIGLKLYLNDGHVYYGATEECVHNPQSDRNTVEYRQFRSDVLQRDNYKCCECGTTENLHVHHIKSYKEFPFERFNVDNGITLCGKCHRKAHGRKQASNLEY